MRVPPEEALGSPAVARSAAASTRAAPTVQKSLPTRPCIAVAEFQQHATRWLTGKALGLQVVISSAFESSVGLSAFAQLAAALPHVSAGHGARQPGHAHGLGTLGWFAQDVVTRPEALSAATPAFMSAATPAFMTDQDTSQVLSDAAQGLNLNPDTCAPCWSPPELASSSASVTHNGCTYRFHLRHANPEDAHNQITPTSTPTNSSTVDNNSTVGHPEPGDRGSKRSSITSAMTHAGQQGDSTRFYSASSDGSLISVACIRDGHSNSRSSTTDGSSDNRSVHQGRMHSGPQESSRNGGGQPGEAAGPHLGSVRTPIQSGITTTKIPSSSPSTVGSMEDQQVWTYLTRQSAKDGIAPGRSQLAMGARGQRRGMLFLHGFLGTGEDWVPLMQALSLRYRCLAVDLPGHGRTLVTSSSHTSNVEPGTGLRNPLHLHVFGYARPCSVTSSGHAGPGAVPDECTVRFGSTAKVLAECKLKYYRFSEWVTPQCPLVLIAGVVTHVQQSSHTPATCSRS